MALVSCRKRSYFVAIYITKYPYVTVWDMSSSLIDAEPWRDPLYRSHFPVVRNIVDARDIGHLLALRYMNDEMNNWKIDSSTGSIAIGLIGVIMNWFNMLIIPVVHQQIMIRNRGFA